MRASFATRTVLLCLTAASISGCHQGSRLIAHNNGAADPASRGKQIIQTYGCGKCHTIPGIAGANGVVGPPLVSVAQRTYIAGNFPNTPENLTEWVIAPQKMKPKTDMPTLGLSETQARNVVAYLETLQ